MKKIDTTKEIQDISLQILIQFDKFCSEQGLRYSLAAGTMLGAIRHKGFIPWDDDIDVLMPRPDYDQLINYKGQIGSDLSITNLNNMETPFYAYSKLVDNKTVLIEDISIPNESGIGIDIFPVDGLPDDYKSIKKHFKMLKIYKRLINLATLRIVKGKSTFNYFLKIVLIPPARLVLNLPSIVKKLDKTCRKYDYESSKKVAAQTLNYGEKEILSKETFDDYVDVEFCGLRFKAISNYETYLTNLFGNYMELPPIEKRKSTHTYLAYYK